MPSVVAHAHNPSVVAHAHNEAVGLLQVQNQIGLQSKLKNSLNYIARPGLRKTKKKRFKKLFQFSDLINVNFRKSLNLDCII